MQYSTELTPCSEERLLTNRLPSIVFNMWFTPERLIQVLFYDRGWAHGQQIARIAISLFQFVRYCLSPSPRAGEDPYIALEFSSKEPGPGLPSHSSERL